MFRVALQQFRQELHEISDSRYVGLALDHHFAHTLRQSATLVDAIQEMPRGDVKPAVSSKANRP